MALWGARTDEVGAHTDEKEVSTDEKKVRTAKEGGAHGCQEVRTSGRGHQKPGEAALEPQGHK
jgi:hypothetical protein